MHNVSLIKYPDCWQYRIYECPVGADEKPYDITKDEFFQPLLENPFTGRMERMKVVNVLPEPDTPEWLAMKKRHSLESSFSRTVNTVYYKARSNRWDWFVTLTFDPQKVDSFSYDECTQKLKNWLIYIRRICPGIKYILVPEKHKSGRFHFHGLFAGCDGLDFVDSGVRDKWARPIYNVGRYSLGFTTATPIGDNGRVTKYISKYITKELCSVTPGKKRYWCSRNLLEAEIENFSLCGDDFWQMLEDLRASADYEKLFECVGNKILYLEVKNK